ncbi:hypothetical protein U0070_000969, partial [Myodes glareolus]
MVCQRRLAVAIEAGVFTPGQSCGLRPGRVDSESLVNGGIVEPGAKAIMFEDVSGLSLSISGNKNDLLEMTDEEQQGQCLRIVSPVSPTGLYCCYAVIIVLTVAVIALSVALSLS